MKRIYFLIIGVLLTGCWSKQDPLSFERPVKIAEVEPLNSYTKRFAGMVYSANSVDLAFGVGGLVNNMYVSDGQTVNKGQILASLDDSDFKLEKETTLESFNAASSILERTKRLKLRDAVSTQELELAQVDYIRAQNNYNYAVNQLSNTKLYAPFKASIERQYVDTYQEVNAGTLIYRLIDPYCFDIKFTLPESDANMLLVPVNYSVEFNNLPNRRFNAEVKSVVDGSVLSAGIPITLTITDPNFDAEKLNIKVGFSCKITIQLNDNKAFNSYVTVPLTALINSEQLWVYNKKNSTVELREITVDGLTQQNMVIISQGLKAQESVVVAGVFSLSNNQKVSVLE